MTNATPDAIFRIATGFMASKHLFAAAGIGLFEKLAGGAMTLDELATACGVPRRTVRISADAMLSLGLLEREGARYRNSDAAAAFLSGSGPGPDLRPMLRFWDRISYGLWAGLETAMRTGEGHRQFSRFSNEEQQIFSAGVEAFSGGASAALAAKYDFSPHRRVLDVGGGTGSFLIPILRRYAALYATLFELPGACSVARTRLAREPEGARVTVVEGDFLKDPLPGSHDLVIVANTIHVLSAEHNIDLLKNIRANATTDTRLLLVDLWLDAARTGPQPAPLMSGEFLVVSGEGQAYGEADADEWLTQTGWRKLGAQPLAGPASVIVAVAT
jgi:SAM-dependent methyltransferase